MFRKRIPLLIIAFISLATYSQTDTIPFKGANTILIETGLSNTDALYNWGRHLTQSGYTIERYDDLFFTLATEPTNTSKFNWDFIIKSSVVDTGIIVNSIKWKVKSSVLAGTSATDYFDWEYSKGKNNAYGIIYRDFIPAVNSFGQYIVKYEKR